MAHIWTNVMKSLTGPEAQYWAVDAALKINLSKVSKAYVQYKYTD